MNANWQAIRTIRRRREQEHGRLLPPGAPRVALLYPSPYRTGMSSLGFQQVAHLLADAGFGVERAFVPDEGVGSPILTIESESPLSDFALVAVSIAWELELSTLVAALTASGIPPLRSERTRDHPRVLIGGPLTFSNPMPVTPMSDAMLVGDADAGIADIAHAVLEGDWDRVQASPGGFVPGGDPPDLAHAGIDLLPATSRILSPEAELSDMFLVEGVRGCARACGFCVMRGSPEHRLRVIPADRVLASVPADAKKVGLVGAGIGDHPDLGLLLDAFHTRGTQVGISSLRADRLAREPDLIGRLARSGLQTLTIAADASSDRLRRTIHKGVTTQDLLTCAEAAAQDGFRTLKLYVMVGLPNETDDDIDELLDLARRMASLRPLTLAISPFVPKKRTPMAGASFAGIHLLEARMSRILGGLRGVAEVRTDGPKTAWVESVLARGGEAEGLAVVDAVRAGGRFAHLKRAFRAIGWDPDQ